MLGGRLLVGYAAPHQPKEGLALIEAAAQAGLDFIAVTDHNTSSHFSALRELQPYHDKLLLIPGAEITTFGGHANIFGQSRWVDFRVGSPSVPDIAALQKDAAAAGDL